MEETNKENDQNADTNIIVSKKRKSNDDVSIGATKPKRTPTNIDRLGVSSQYGTNDDEFFETIQHTQSIDTSDKELEMIEGNGDQITQSQNTKSVDENNVGEAAKGGGQTNNEQRSQNESICENRTELNVMSRGEKILYSKVIDLMTELKIIQKGITELQALKVTKQNDTSMKRLKRDQLAELELPLENETQMKNFEKKLKDDDFFKKTVCYNFICF